MTTTDETKQPTAEAPEEQPKPKVTRSGPTPLAESDLEPVSGGARINPWYLLNPP